MNGGMQAWLCNEWDSRTRSYRIVPAESLVRGLAGAHPNSYHVCIFACCREVPRKDRSSPKDNGSGPTVDRHYLHSLQDHKEGKCKEPRVIACACGSGGEETKQGPVEEAKEVSASQQEEKKGARSDSPAGQKKLDGEPTDGAGGQDPAEASS